MSMTATPLISVRLRICILVFAAVVALCHLTASAQAPAGTPAGATSPDAEVTYPPRRRTTRFSFRAIRRRTSRRALHVGSNWFVSPQVLVDSNQFNAYSSSGSLASVYRIKQAGGGVDFGYQLGRSQEFRVGYTTEYLKYSLQVGENTEPTVSGREGYAQFQYQLIHTNDPVIPTTGQLGAFKTQWFESYPSPTSAYNIPPFPATQGGIQQFVPISERNTLVFSGGGGTVYGTNNANIGLPIFSIGGPRLFAAYGTNEILTNEYGYGQFSYLRQLAQLPPFLGGKLYFVARLEGGAYERFDTPRGQPAEYRNPADGVGGLIVNTIFGPVLIGGAVGDAGHHRFFFSLGRVF